MTTLVLLPGMDGTGLLFTDFVAALGNDLEARIVRYPGSKLLGYAELESRVRAALPTEGPFVLLGESFSGPIAISIAAAAPSNLCGLILCSTFARYPLPQGIKLLAKLLPVSRLPSPAWVSRFLFGRFAAPPLMAQLATAMREVAPAVRRSRLHALVDVDVREKLARIKVPTLYLRASADRVVARAALEAILERLPQTQVIEFPAPHGLLQTMPAQTAQAVGEFCRRVVNHQLH